MNWIEKNTLGCHGMMFIVPYGVPLAGILLDILFSAGTMQRLASLLLVYSTKYSVANIFPPLNQRSKAPNEEKIPLLMPQHQMVLPHYMGISSDIDINRKISEFEPEGLSRKNSFSSETPPDDIPLLLPHEANGPESSVMENKWNDFNSGRFTPNEKIGHSRSRSLSYQDTRFSFFDNYDTANIKSASSLETTSEFDPQRTQVKSANEVTQVGPRSLCRCQVSYNYQWKHILLKLASDFQRSEMRLPSLNNYHSFLKIIQALEKYCFLVIWFPS